MDMIRFTSRKQLETYREEPLDILFMDVMLDDDDGIEETEEMNRRWTDCQLVYLTDYIYFATEVYHREHVFYVLKNQFAEQIGEIFEKIFHQLSQTREKLNFSVIGGEKLAVAPKELLYFERKGRVTRIHSSRGLYSICDKLPTLVERLPALDFVRCHNSYIVYFPAVRELQEKEFLMNDGSRVPISRRCAKSVKEAFAKWEEMQIS